MPHRLQCSGSQDSFATDSYCGNSGGGGGGIGGIGGGGIGIGIGGIGGVGGGGVAGGVGIIGGGGAGGGGPITASQWQLPTCAETMCPHSAAAQLAGATCPSMPVTNLMQPPGSVLPMPPMPPMFTNGGGKCFNTHTKY